MDNEMEIVASHMTEAPVDLVQMFRDLGISYREAPISSGESAWIERNGDKFSVLVNSADSEVRRRFSAAHELGHYLLHRDLMNDGARMNRHTDRLYGDGADDSSCVLFKPRHEVQANRIAAQIIMPAELVRRKHAERPGLAEMARAFKVSKAAMEIRLKTLGLV
jgi:Zn-dependent peptidase ImmA (M78 family)